MVGNQSGDAKKDDDLADSARYCSMLVPWDMSAVNEKLQEELKEKLETARPMTEAEFQAMQIKMRRGEDVGVPKSEEIGGWGELEAEFDHWNQEYGQ